MYRPYDSGSDSGSESVESGSEASVTSQHRAIDQWRSQVLEDFADTNQGPGPGPGPGPSDLQYNQTTLLFESSKPVQVLTVDSLDRDQTMYPSPMSIRLKLPQVYKNVTRIDIVQIKMMNGFHTLTAAKENTTLTVYDSSDNKISVTIPDGTYTAMALADALNAAFKVASSSQTFKITYAASSGRFVITSPAMFRIPFLTSLTSVSKYSWGLGWNMGFGGPPTDLPRAKSHIATYMPRLTTEYIHLRLNESDNMNTVDCTGPEDLAVSLDSTGQTSRYFGKLLLNDFGAYAQTFIESPKIFKPVLSRLDRLSFDWVDKSGAAITGSDSLSCEWHMTVRIIQVKDTQTESSAIIRGPI